MAKKYAGPPSQSEMLAERNSGNRAQTAVLLLVPRWSARTGPTKSAYQSSARGTLVVERRALEAAAGHLDLRVVDEHLQVPAAVHRAGRALR